MNYISWITYKSLRTLNFGIVILSVLLYSSCKSKESKSSSINNNNTFYVGTYTNKESKGIYKFSLQNNGELKFIGLVAETVNPSYLAISKDRKHLLSVGENDQEGVGTVESYLILEDSLKLINKSSSGGAHPCHVSLNYSGNVLVANYSSGNVGLLQLNKEGELSDLLDIEQHTGRGTTDRQNSPHAHSAWFDAKGKEIISVDLGSNELWFSHLNSERNKLVPNSQNKLRMADGAGPRHLTRHPNKKWIYVLNELDCTVTLVNKNNNTYNIISSASTLPNDYTGLNTCADIHISSDGKFVYASNRGHDSIAIFEVKDDGSLILIGHQSTHGKTPRNFSLSPDNNYVLVANQNSDNIVSFKRDQESGLLNYLNEVYAPSPVCIVF